MAQDTDQLPLTAPSTDVPLTPPVAPGAAQSDTATPGVAALGTSAPASDDTGKATIGDLPSAQALTSLMPTPRQPQSPTVQAIADGANAAAKSNPAAAAAPGGWARTLLAGAMHGLGGAAKVAGDVGQVAGDMATGGLSGAMIRARKNAPLIRERQNVVMDKEKMLNAEANARMVQEQTLTHKLQEEAIDESLKSGQEQLQTWRNQANPGVEKAKGLTSDQAKDMIKNDGADPSEETAIPTGIINSTDKSGRPYRQLTYSIVKTTPVTLDPRDPDQKATLDRLNKYAPPEKGKTWQGDQNGIVNFGGAQYNMLYQQANDRQVVNTAIRRATLAAGVAEEDVKKGEEALSFSKDPNVIKAINSSMNPTTGQPDMISARNSLYLASQNPKSPLYGKYNNIDNDMRERLGYTEDDKGKKSYVFDKMLDDYQKKQDTAMDEYVGLLKDADKAHGDEAASLAQTFTAKANDPSIPPGLRAVYAKKAIQLNAQAKAGLDFAADKKKRETDAENQANTGDMSGIMDMVKNYDYDPDKLFSRFKDLKAKRDFIAQVYAETGQQWSDSEYKARYATKQDYRPEGKGGQAVQSLNTFALHTGDANGLIQKLDNTKSPLLNKPINKWDESVLGKPEVMQYRVAIAAAADNYINYLLNNKAKHASDDDLAAKLQSTDTSPAMAQVMMRQMANTIALKAREQNFAYRKQMGKDIPDFLDPDTIQVLRTFGINADQINTSGPSGLISTGQQASKPPAGAQTAIKDQKGNIIGYR